MDTIYWEKAWAEAQSESMFTKHPVEESRWQRFWEEEAEQFQNEIIAEQAYYRRIIDYLTREEVLNPDDTVLDIACGPGTYSLLFAEKAKTVTSLDPSSKMLSVLMDEATRRSISNIRPVHSRWHDFTKKSEHDLVFTALSPAVKKPGDLFELERASRRNCCFVMYGPGGEPILREEIWNILTGEKTGDNLFNVTYPLNLLYAMGRKPNLRFFDQESKIKIEADRLIDNNIRFFSLFVNIDAEKKAKVAEYINSRSKNGFYETVVKKSLAVLHWNIHQR